MATSIRKFLSVALVVLVPVAVFAQNESVAMEEAIDTLDQMVVDVVEFVGDVRFDEDDVKSLIDLGDEYSEFGDDYDDDNDTIDFNTILSDNEYRRWAASHNLDANDWMRKTVRITMVLYREQMLAMAAIMPEQIAQQLEMMEQQREQLGEEMYQQISQGIKETAAYGEAMMEGTRRLPEPTAAEKAILDQYRDELLVFMEFGDEDEGYEEYEEYEDDEDYEDDGDYEGYNE